jgi:hypothetical protein
MMRKRKAVISASANGETGQDLIVGEAVKQLPEGKPMLMVISIGEAEYILTGR